MWSWSTNVTDGQTDRQTDNMQSQDSNLHFSASHGKKLELSISNLLNICCVAESQHALILRSKYRRSRSHSQGYQMRCRVGMHVNMTAWTSILSPFDCCLVRQVIKMLLAIVLLFAICWSPTLVDNVLVEFGMVDRYHHGYLRYARQAFALMSYGDNVLTSNITFLDICDLSVVVQLWSSLYKQMLRTVQYWSDPGTNHFWLWSLFYLSALDTVEMCCYLRYTRQAFALMSHSSGPDLRGWSRVPGPRPPTNRGPPTKLFNFIVFLSNDRYLQVQDLVVVHCWSLF